MKAMLPRLVFWSINLWIIAYTVVIGISLLLQFVGGELPCPLCMLQRYAMILSTLGAVWIIRQAQRGVLTWDRYVQDLGLGALGAFVGAVFASRQIMLHILPGDQGYGGAVLGLHLYSWAFVTFCVVILFTALLGVLAPAALPEAPARNSTADRISSAVGLALVVSTVASMIGVLSVVWMAVKLPPAEAMRPEPPTDFKPSLLERMGLTRWFTPTFRMALRNIERRPWQSLFTMAGLALATGLMVLPGSMQDSIDHLLTYQWNDHFRQNVIVSMRDPSSRSTQHDLEHLPGAIRVEPLRGFIASVSNAHHERRLYILGFAKGHKLINPRDAQGRPLVLPGEGLVVSQKLAEVLGVKIGDRLQVQVLEGRCEHREVTVRGFMADFYGMAAYMDIDAVRHLLRESDTMTGAFLTVDTNRWDDFMREVKKQPKIEFASVKKNELAAFRASTGQSIGTLRQLFLWMAVIVAFGVVYNSARIALSERGRDLATLRVVGLTKQCAEWCWTSLSLAGA